VIPGEIRRHRQSIWARGGQGELWGRSRLGRAHGPGEEHGPGRQQQISREMASPPREPRTTPEVRGCSAICITLLLLTGVRSWGKYMSGEGSALGGGAGRGLREGRGGGGE